MKTFRVLSVILIAALVLAACAPAATPAPTQPPAKATEPPKPTAGKPLKIGLLTDQTGALAIYGPMLENGFALGLDYATGGTNAVAGRPIQVVIKDTASKADVGIAPSPAAPGGHRTGAR